MVLKCTEGTENTKCTERTKGTKGTENIKNVEGTESTTVEEVLKAPTALTQRRRWRCSRPSACGSRTDPRTSTPSAPRGP